MRKNNQNEKGRSGAVDLFVCGRNRNRAETSRFLLFRGCSAKTGFGYFSFVRYSPPAFRAFFFFIVIRFPRCPIVFHGGGTDGNVWAESKLPCLRRVPDKTSDEKRFSKINLKTDRKTVAK